MTCAIHILTDVSYSMKGNLQISSRPTDNQITRAQSIFNTIINIADRKVDRYVNDKIFVMAFGLKDFQTCDLVGLLEKINGIDDEMAQENLIQLLANNGAPYAADYVKEYVTNQKEARLFFNVYSKNISKLREYIEGLPDACKYKAAYYSMKRVKGFSYSNQKEKEKAQEHIERARQFIQKCSEGNSYKNLIQLLIDNGAPFASDYVYQFLTEGEADLFFYVYSRSFLELKYFINNLPIPCKYEFANNIFHAMLNTEKNLKLSWFGWDFTNKAKNKSVQKHLENAKNFVRQYFLPDLEELELPNERTLKATIDLIHKLSGSQQTTSSNEKFLSEKQFSKILDSIDLFIYGDTPLCKALNITLNMSISSSHEHKFLFLLTDGEATDGRVINLAEKIKESKITVIVCLLTANDISNPKRLYYKPDHNWPQIQKDMFEICSTIDNSSSAMSILLEQNWEIDLAGKSKLFVQANHPDIIKQFSSIIRNMSENNDALLNIFGKISLDMYINSGIKEFEAPEQDPGTCYANTIAAVFHLAMRTIVCREGGVPDFNELRNELIEENGERGAITIDVINNFAPKYRLRYRIVDENGAKAINERRPVVARYCWFRHQKDAFKRFYFYQSDGILDKKHLYTYQYIRRYIPKPIGHAVVLIKCDPEYLTFMNSWGTTWADKGLFKVRDQSVLNMQFYDVFWKVNDLKNSEIIAFEREKLKVTEDFIQRYIPEDLHEHLFECPRCLKSSPANRFIGRLNKAKCPKCHKILCQLQ